MKLQKAKGISKALRNFVYNKIYFTARDKRAIINRFHELYYYGHPFGKTWNNTYWLGVRTLKCPLDLWVYQEMIFEQRPDLIVECGTASGGSALFLASMFDLVGSGEIITIDIEPNPARPTHPRITYITGSSVDTGIVDKVTAAAAGKQKVMVILDSDHSHGHVLKEMRAYHKLVTSGSYMVVEDTNINGHPVLPAFGPGPMEAVDDFMKENSDFAVDETKEKFLLTFNPRGFLKKKA
jgi:cephalosporin hydroxylase